MIRNVCTFALALLFVLPLFTSAQVLEPLTSENTITVTTGTTTSEVEFSSPTGRSAADRLRDVLFFLRNFDSPRADIASTTETPTTPYLETASYVFDVAETDTAKSIDAIAQLASDSGAVCHTFSGSFTLGDSAPEVREIQRFLNTVLPTPLADSGPGSKGEETEYFGALTLTGVLEFQTAHAAVVLTPLGLFNPTGYWGASTRAHANTLNTCE